MTSCLRRAAGFIPAGNVQSLHLFGENPRCENTNLTEPAEALHNAVIDKISAEVRALIRSGLDVNLKDKKGWTPLHFAAQEQDLDIVRLLLKAGALVDERDSNGNTPLSKAVFRFNGSSESGEIIKILREAGADPLATNNHGISPLALARGIGNTRVSECFTDLP